MYLKHLGLLLFTLATIFSQIVQASIEKDDPFLKLESSNGLPRAHQILSQGTNQEIKEFLLTEPNLLQKDINNRLALEVLFRNPNFEDLALFTQSIISKTKFQEVSKETKLKLLYLSAKNNWKEFINQTLKGHTLFSPKKLFENYLGEAVMDQIRKNDPVFFISILENYSSLNEAGFNPYCQVIYLEDHETLTALLNKKIIPANNCGIHQQSPLQLAISFNTPDRLIAKLLHLTPLIDSKDKLGNSAITTAIHRSNQNALRMILKQKIHLSIRVSEVVELIESALNHSDFEVFKTIYETFQENPEYKQKLAKTDFLASMLSSSLSRYFDDSSFFNFIFREIETQERDNPGTSKKPVFRDALVKATELELPLPVRKLLELGVDPNQSFDLLGHAPLHQAVKLENQQLVDLLLRYGAEVNLLTQDSRHAISFAGRNKKLIATLIEAGAKLSVHATWKTAVADNPTNKIEHQDLERSLAPILFDSKHSKLELEVNPKIGKANFQIQIFSSQRQNPTPFKVNKILTLNQGKADITLDFEEIRDHFKLKGNSEVLNAKVILDLGSMKFQSESKNLLFPFEVRPVVYLPNTIGDNIDGASEQIRDYLEKINPPITYKEKSLNLYPFFLWTFDWRKDLEKEFEKLWMPDNSQGFLSSIKKLKENEFLRKTFTPKFTFIGEGVGGLILKRMITDSKYVDYVNSALFLETPFYGTPSAILALTDNNQLDDIKGLERLEDTDIKNRKSSIGLFQLFPSEDYQDSFLSSTAKALNYNPFKTQSLIFQKQIQNQDKLPLNRIQNFVIKTKEPETPGVIGFNSERNLATMEEKTLGSSWVPLHSQKGPYASHQVIEIQQAHFDIEMARKKLLDYLPKTFAP